MIVFFIIRLLSYKLLYVIEGQRARAATRTPLLPQWQAQLCSMAEAEPGMLDIEHLGRNLLEGDGDTVFPNLDSIESIGGAEGLGEVIMHVEEDSEVPAGEVVCTGFCGRSRECQDPCSESEVAKPLEFLGDLCVYCALVKTLIFGYMEEQEGIVHCVVCGGGRLRSLDYRFVVCVKKYIMARTGTRT